MSIVLAYRSTGSFCTAVCESCLSTFLPADKQQNGQCAAAAALVVAVVGSPAVARGCPFRTVLFYTGTCTQVSIQTQTVAHIFRFSSYYPHLNNTTYRYQYHYQDHGLSILGAWNPTSISSVDRDIHTTVVCIIPSA